MGARTFQFAKNSPLRTTLIDETTGNAAYQIDTPSRIHRSVTRIRKLASSPQSTLVLSGSTDSNSDDDPTNKGGKKEGFKWKNLIRVNLPETRDEIARIQWKCFSSDVINFQGKVTTRKEFLPKCGKMKQ